jgi:hypothetical protein
MIFGSRLQEEQLILLPTMRKLTWSFDERGNNTEFTESLRKDGEMLLFQKNISTFDDRGNVLTTQHGNGEGMKLTTQYFSYEFDSRGNWIMKESASLPLDSTDVRLKQVELRVITYYEKQITYSPAL